VANISALNLQQEKKFHIKPSFKATMQEAFSFIMPSFEDVFKAIPSFENAFIVS